MRRPLTQPGQKQNPGRARPVPCCTHSQAPASGARSHDARDGRTHLGKAVGQNGARYTATGVIDSPYTDTVTHVYAAAMCVNAAGKIVGGGDTFLDANLRQTSPTPPEPNRQKPKR